MMADITVTATRVGRISSVSVSGAGVEGGVVSFSAVTNWPGEPITYRVYRGATVVSTSTSASYTLVTADVGQSMRVSASQGGAEVFSNTFSVVAAPGPVIPGGAANIYVQDFSTDRSADFYGGEIAHYSDRAYYDSYVDAYGRTKYWAQGYRYYEGASVDGYMAFGGGATTTTTRTITFEAYPGKTYELYTLASMVGLGTYTGSNVGNIYLDWLNASNAVIASEPIVSSILAPIQRDMTAPVNAAKLRVTFVNKASATSHLAMAIFFLGFYDTTSTGRRPVYSGVTRANIGQICAPGVAKTIDYSKEFSGAAGYTLTMLDGTGSLASEPHTSTSGTLTITAATTSASPQERFVHAVSGGLRSHGPAPVTLHLINPPTLAIAPVWTPFDACVQVGKKLVLDAIAHVDPDTGVWPYTATVLSKPSWMTETVNGCLEGTTPNTPAAAETVVVRVTDQRGDHVDITRTVAVVSSYASLPATHTPAAGTSSSPTILKTVLGTLPTGSAVVVDLAPGYYQMDSWQSYNRDPRYPIIFRGAGRGQTFIVGKTLLHRSSGFVFMNLCFKNLAPYGDPTSLSDRQSPVFSASTLSTIRPTSHNYLYGCRVEGYVGNLSLETADWCRRISSDGKVLFANTPGSTSGMEAGWDTAYRADDQWVATNFPDLAAEYGHAYYNGGIGVSGAMMVEDLEIEYAAIGMTMGGMSSGIYDVTISRCRTDAIRLVSSQGCVCDGLMAMTSTHGGNHNAQEHGDIIQTMASGNDPLAHRVLLRNSGLIATRPYHQGWQGNINGSNTDAGIPAQHPRKSHEDVIVEDCLIASATMSNLFSVRFGDYRVSRCAIVQSPAVDTTLTSQGIVSTGAGAVMRLENSIVTNELGTICGENSGNIVIGTGAATIFPQIGNVNADYASRFAISASWAAANPGVGPAWLRAG